MRGLINHRHVSSGGSSGGGDNPGGGGGSGPEKILLSVQGSWSLNGFGSIAYLPLVTLRNDNASRFSIVSNSVQIDQPGLYKITGAIGLGAEQDPQITTTIAPSVLRSDMSTYFLSHIPNSRIVEPILINAAAGNRVSMGILTNGFNINVIGVLTDLFPPGDPALENQMTYFSIEHVPLS